MAITTINLTDQISTFVSKTNEISTNLGDVATLTTTATNLVGAINEIKSIGLVDSDYVASAISSGTANIANTANLATSVTITANNTTNETVYLTFVDGATDSQGLETDTGLTYNPNENRLTAGNLNVGGTIQGNIITATTVTANLIGNASTATTASVASNVTITANNTTNETVYLTFVDGATDSQGLETDTGLTYNPSTNTLTAGTFSGALSGNATTATSATTATNVTATANNSTNETVYLTFVDGATGAQGIETDTALTYNPSTNTLTTGIYKLTNWTVEETAGVLLFKTGGVAKAKLDASGNFTVVGDITAFGTI